MTGLYAGYYRVAYNNKLHKRIEVLILSSGI